MKFNTKLAIALVMVSGSVFGLVSQVLAEGTTVATPAAVAGIGNFTTVVTGSKANPAAAAAVFSTDAQGKITGGAVSASVGSSTAAATASYKSSSQGNGSTASAVGTSGFINAQENQNGTITFSTYAAPKK